MRFVDGLVGLTVELLVEALGVDGGAGWGGDAGKDRQGKQGGYDGLHDFSPVVGLLFRISSLSVFVASFASLVPPDMARLTLT